jgi:hypothetical protein
MNVAFVELDVNKKVFVPVLNLLSGGGIVFGSLTKNVPVRLPILSLINLLFFTNATAPLSPPTNLKPVSKYP